MRYFIKIKEAGVLKDTYFIRNVIKYSVFTSHDNLILLVYDKEIKEYLLFGKTIIRHYERYFSKRNIVEISITEKMSDKVKQLKEFVKA